MSDKVWAKAKATVVLELDIDAKWGEDCKMDQIYKQASDAVNLAVSQMVKGCSLRIKLIENPNITAVILPEKK